MWWHIRIGRMIAAAHRVPHRDPLSIGGTHAHWVVTSWLSDLLYGVTYDALGYRGVQVLRAVSVALVLAALAWTLRERRGPVRTLVFLVTAVPLISFFTERPQLFSFVFVAWLADRLPRIVRGGPLPRWWAFLVFVWFWANVHGLWVLAPVLLGVTAVAVVAQRGRAALRTAASCVALAAGSVVAAALTPVGWRLALQPFAVGQSARAVISEWLPSVLFSMPALGVLLLLGLLLVAWARGTWVVPRGDLVWTLAVTLFALTATRNLATGAILLAPVVALHLERTFPPSAPDTLVPSWALAVVCVGGLAGSAYGLLARPAVAPEVPRRLVATLQRQPAPLRVIDAYNVGGLLIGPESPDLRVAIDGRTDLYEPAYITSYLAALRLGGDWETLLRGLDARYAVLRHDSPLAHVLRVEWGWREVTTDHGWVLLAAS